MFLAVVIGVPAYFSYKEEPTCFDGKMNGNENGVDCGGSCQLVCAFQASDPIVKWDESFEVRPGEWGAVAYVENPNDAFIANIDYLFRFVDEKGVTIALREGNTYIPPRSTFAVFESGISLGERVPAQEFFSFEEDKFTWKKSEFENRKLEIRSIRISENQSGTRLSGVIVNPSVREVKNIEVIGILYDLEGNAIAASETTVSSLGEKGSADVVFTWPRDFGEQVARREILYKVVPN